MRPAAGALLGGLLVLWGGLLGKQVRGLRHSVYWNASNHRFFDEDYAVQVSINDYLDIYCPHYEQPLSAGGPETFTLLMVDGEGYRGCYETPGAFKRWECNRPYAPYGPVRFSEKIQRFTPFSLGFEFQPGRDYYYISIPTAESPGRCLKLRVSVCCKATTVESVTEGPKSQPRGRGNSEVPTDPPFPLRRCCCSTWTQLGPLLARPSLLRARPSPPPWALTPGRAGWAPPLRVQAELGGRDGHVFPPPRPSPSRKDAGFLTWHFRTRRRASPNCSGTTPQSPAQLLTAEEWLGGITCLHHRSGLLSARGRHGLAGSSLCPDRDGRRSQDIFSPTCRLRWCQDVSPVPPNSHWDCGGGPPLCGAASDRRTSPDTFAKDEDDTSPFRCSDI